MFGELPYELVLNILQGLPVKDLVNVRKTCKELYAFTEDRSLWNYVLSGLLSYPLPYTVRIEPSLWPQSSRQRALVASRVDEAWHDKNILPRHIHFLPSVLGLKDVLLLPGGEWLVSLLHDGTLQLQAVHGIAPAFQLATCMNPANLTSQRSSVHISLAQDIYVIYSFTTGVFIYRIDVHDIVNPIELVNEVKAEELPGLPYTGRVFAGGNLIAMLCSDARGSAQLHVRRIPPGHNPILQTQMNVVLDSEDSISAGYCTVQIISSDRLLLSTCRRIYMYAIPPMSTSPVPADVSPLWSEELHAVHPGETSACVGSPVIWGAPGPLMLWRPCRVFVVEPGRDACTLRSYPSPYGAENVRSGLRHGCYTTNFPKDGLLVNLYTFTDEVKRLAVSSFALGPGSGNVAVLGCSMDEWSGKICLHIEDVSWVTTAYTVLIDVA